MVAKSACILAAETCAALTGKRADAGSRARPGSKHTWNAKKRGKQDAQSIRMLPFGKRTHTHTQYQTTTKYAFCPENNKRNKRNINRNIKTAKTNTQTKQNTPTTRPRKPLRSRTPSSPKPSRPPSYLARFRMVKGTLKEIQLQALPPPHQVRARHETLRGLTQTLPSVTKLNESF